MNDNIKNRDFKVLSDREHVLARPTMYISGVDRTTQEQWILDNTTNKFKFTSVNVVPGLLKIINEIIDNSIDVAIDTNFKFANKIHVSVDDKSVTVIDNGIGIPVKTQKNSDDPRTLTEIAWTTLRSGTSFDDNRKKIGTNGLGGASAVIFSTKFIGTSDDGKKRQTITCTNNMENICAGKIKPSTGKSGVEVYIEPDLKRFGINMIDDTHKTLIYQRLIDLAISFPKIRFYFNDKLISLSTKKFANMFSDDSILMSTENTTICIFPNEHDDFRFYAQLNGLNTFKGGTHVDYVINEIANRLRDKLIRKYKTIRPGDIRNKLGLAIIFTDFNNPKFNSQSKESISNSISDISKHIDGKIDFDKFSKLIFKSDAIINPIIDMFKLKEELKARQELKRVKKVKVRSDKYMKPIGAQKYLALCEGASAMSGISSCLGRDGIGYYAMRGVPLNAYASSTQKIAANTELKDIINILGLDISKSDEAKNIDFDKILITTDADADGAHITAMLIGWFKKFAMNLFNEGKICKLITPNIILEDTKGKIVKYFMTLTEFKKWEANNQHNKYKIVYLKGLGSWSREQLIGLIETEGLDKFILEYHLDKEGEVYIDDWLGDDAEKRKKYLREYTFDINQA
jgi:DNA gyrase/topoisomerase IV subunit B